MIRLRRHKNPRVSVNDETQMFAIIRAAFNQRRKTLTNSLNNAPGISFTKEQIVQALHELELSETIRGEALTLEDFARLSNLLGQQK